MLNLDKINKVDMGNLNLDQLKKQLLENQKKVMLMVLVVSLGLCLKIHMDFDQKIKALHTKISKEQDKLTAIQSRQDAIKKMTDYKASIPKQMNVFDLVTLIANAAKQHETSVISYTPSLEKDMGLYSVIDVNFSLVANNFKEMMLFLRKVERSNFPIIINTWSGQEGKDGAINFNIAIRAVLIHS